MSKRLLVRDQQGERERLLVGTMTVGRDTRCDISDADPLLSRRHAEFVCRPDSLVVRDLNSRNGISVNGVKVQEAVLRPGDVIRIARLVMTYLGDLNAVRSSPPSSPAIDRMRAPNTEKVPAAPPGLDGQAPEDDRTRVVARSRSQSTTSPDQVAVARVTPSAPVPGPTPAPSIDAPNPDDDRTQSIVRQEEIKTDTPILPLSALGAARPFPPASVPVLPPPPSVPFDDLSLELRPRPVEAPSSRLSVASKPGSDRIVVATVGLAVLAFAFAAVPMMIWLTYRRDVPAVLWNFVVVLGPSLLCSLAAGVALARWLRRSATRG